MAGNRIADFFAEIGIKADIGALAKIDKKLDDLERALHNLEKGAQKSVKKVTEPLNALSSAARSSTKSVNNLKKAEDDLNKASGKSNKQLGDRAKQLSKIEKLQLNIVKSPLSTSISEATAGLGRSRAEYEKFWKSAQAGQYLVANKANQISQGGRERVDDIRHKRIDHVARAREAMLDRVLSNTYDKSLPRDKQYNPRDSIKSSIDGLLNPMKELSKKAHTQAQRMYDDLFAPVGPNAALKNRIRNRLDNTNPAIAGKFGNLALAENRLARERTELATQEAKIKAEAAAKAIADEKARAKYMAQAQRQYLLDMEKAAKLKEREERAAARAQEMARRAAERNAVARQREAERAHREADRAARREVIDQRRAEAHASRMAAYNRMGRRGVGRPSGINFDGGAGVASQIRQSIAGFLPGFGLAYGLMNINKMNQQQQGQASAMTAVMGQDLSKGGTVAVTPQQAQAAGQEQIDWANTLSDKLGINAMDSVSSYSKMLASGLPAGMNVKGIQNVFQGVSEYGRVMGLDGEAMKGSMVAIEQMMNKQQIYSEELKTQLAERMPGVESAMAEAAGFGKGEDAVAKLLDAMKEGKVKTKDVIEKFSKILSDRARAGGALEKAINTSTAEQQRYANSISRWVKKFSENGGEAGFARIFRAFREELDSNGESAIKLGQAFDKLSVYIRGLVKGAGELFRMFMSLAPKIGITENMLLGLSAVIVTLMLPFGEFVLLFAGLLLVLEDLQSWADGGGSLFKDIFEGLDPKTQENIKLLWEEIKNLGAALKELGGVVWDGWNKLFEFWLDNGGADDVLKRMREMVRLAAGITGAIASMGKGDLTGMVKHLETALDAGVNGLGILGYLNKDSDKNIADRNERIRGSNDNAPTLPATVAKANAQGMTPQDLIARMNAMADDYAKTQKTNQITIGDIKVEITSTATDATTMTEEVGKQLAAHMQQVLLDTAAGIGAQTQ